MKLTKHLNILNILLIVLFYNPSSVYGKTPGSEKKEIAAILSTLKNIFTTQVINEHGKQKIINYIRKIYKTIKNPKKSYEEMSEYLAGNTIGDSKIIPRGSNNIRCKINAPCKLKTIE